MMNYRRFSIDRNQGELIILALSLAIDRIVQIEDPSPYWKYYKEQMAILKTRLEGYDWRKKI